MIHPAKKPMEGGFSMDKFMEGVSKEDGEALAGMPENIPPRQPPELFQNDFYFVNYNEMTVVHSNKPLCVYVSKRYASEDEAWDALLEKATQEFLLWVSAVKVREGYHLSDNASNMLKCKARRARLALNKAVANCGKNWAMINCKEIDEQNG